LQNIDEALKNVATQHGNPGATVNFGGYHMVTMGDFYQHQPPHGSPLFSSKESLNNTDNLGRDLWCSFDHCVMLQEQHRFNMATINGRKLNDMVQFLSSDKCPTRAECQVFCEDLNRTAVTLDEMTAMLEAGPPRAVVLRNAVRHPLNILLGRQQAANKGVRMMAWRAQDTGARGRQLTSAILTMLEGLPPAMTENMPTVQIFYKGIPFKFIDNMIPKIGWINNSTCIGNSIILDPREPPDPLTGVCHILQYLPLAILVQIEAYNTPGDPQNGIPENCIPVMPMRKSMSLKVPEPMLVCMSGGQPQSTFTVSRFGFPLDVSLAVTDCWAQGMSFRGEPFLLHLSIPPTANISRANLLVAISRCSSWEELHLLVQLWPRGESVALARLK
jgi:hypothetical protein